MNRNAVPYRVGKWCLANAAASFMLRVMPQSLANLIVHAVFSTQDRAAWFTDPEKLQSMHAWLGGISAKLECPTLAIGGVADHVHILARLHRTMSVAEWVKELKRASTVWMKEQWPEFAGFHWQAGYGAFSVSQSNTDAVVEYVRTQAEHHRTRSFQDEFRVMLRKHGIAWDERYVWE
jgi:REP element-mobilizing transposase RayT